VHSRVAAGVHTVEVTLPAGVTGVLRLDGRPDLELPAGTHQHTVPAG
jgi:hypothetical protein